MIFELCNSICCYAVEQFKKCDIYIVNSRLVQCLPDQMQVSGVQRKRTVKLTPSPLFDTRKRVNF